MSNFIYKDVERCHGGIAPSFLIYNDVNSVKQVEASAIKIFPNPTNDLVTVELNQLQHYNQIALFDLNGKEVLKTVLPEKQQLITLDLNHVPTGIYFLQIQKQTGGTPIFRKVVKR